MLQSFESSPRGKVLEEAASSLRIKGRKIDIHANAFEAQLDKLSGDDVLFPLILLT